MENISYSLLALGTQFVDHAVLMLLQSSVLIVILLVFTAILRKRVKAIFLYTLWMLVLIKLVLPTSLTTPISIGRLSGEFLRGSTLSAVSAPIPFTAESDPFPIATSKENGIPGSTIPKMQQTVESRRDIPGSVDSVVAQSTAALSWQETVFLVWLATMVPMALLFIQRALFVRGLIRQASPAENHLTGVLACCAEKMGVNRKIDLRLSPNTTSPAVCGLLRPVILLPKSLGAELDQNQLEMVLLHELAHIRRGDLWVNLAQTLLQIVYFYHPLLWLANALIRRIREQAVDETVMVAMNERAEIYPETLVTVAKLAFRRPALGLRLVGVVENKNAFRGRIKHMLNRPVPKNARLNGLGVLSIIVVGSFLLPMAGAESKTTYLNYSTVTVTEGVGFDGITVGDPKCTPAFVQAILGEPDDKKDRWLSYRDTCGMDFYFRPDQRLAEIRLNRGFRGRLNSGISMDSTMEDVFSVFGQPGARKTADTLNRKNKEGVLFTMNGHVRGKKVRRIYYGQQGMLFWFMGDKINQMVTFQLAATKPRIPAAPSTPAKQGSEGGLQARIDSANAGDTVIVPPGVYTAPLTIKKPLHLKGQSREECIFQVTADQPAIFADSRGKGRTVIENLTVQWQLATSDKGIENPVAVLVKDAEGEVKNCTIKAMGNYRRSPLGLRVQGFSNVTIDSCNLTGFEYVVQFMEGTKGTLQDSIIEDCGHQGVINYSRSTMNVWRNVITGSRYHAIRSTGGTLHVKDNLLIGNKNRGIYLGNKSCLGTIRNNAIIGSGTGIGGFARARVQIENNVLIDSSYAGIGSRSSCRLSINNNILTDNPRGLIVFMEDGESRHGLKIGPNTFWQNKTDTENCDKPEGSLTVDPLFTDPTNGDFSLQSGPASEARQGLTDPEVIQSLWRKWQDHKGS